MKGSNRIAKGALMLGVAAVVSIGCYTAAASAARPRPPRPPGGCICPDVYAPVLCPNGLVYSNACVAGCAGQSNCVPIDPQPVPI